MHLGILTTDNGKHSNEKLAIAVAGDLIKFDQNASGPNLLAGRDLETAIIKIMVPFFEAVSSFEHEEIDTKGTAHLAASLDPHPEIFADAVNAVCGAIAASPLAEQWPPRTTKAFVADVIEKWLRNGHHMHRDWFARWGKVGAGTNLEPHEKHDPDCPHVARWKDMHDAPDRITWLAAVAEHAEIATGARSAA